MKELITKNQQKNKSRLDANLAPSKFKEGDLVVIARPTRVAGTANKLQFTYLGPYKIHRKLSDLSFEIEHVNGRTGKSVIHPYHLKIYDARIDDVVDES